MITISIRSPAPARLNIHPAHRRSSRWRLMTCPRRHPPQPATARTSARRGRAHGRAGWAGERDQLPRTVSQRRDDVVGEFRCTVRASGRAGVARSGCAAGRRYTFSPPPSNSTYFQNGIVLCLRGEGTLIWLAASDARAPRRSSAAIPCRSFRTSPARRCSNLQRSSSPAWICSHGKRFHLGVA